MDFRAIAALALFATTITYAGFPFAARAQTGMAASRGGVTALSRKVDAIDMGWTRAAVISTLGSPSNVIAPGKLKANDIDRGPEIEYVLTWENPGCSRIEVFFDARNRVTGSDAGGMCVCLSDETAGS